MLKTNFKAPPPSSLVDCNKLLSPGVVQHTVCSSSRQKSHFQHLSCFLMALELGLLFKLHLPWFSFSRFPSRLKTPFNHFLRCRSLPGWGLALRSSFPLFPHLASGLPFVSLITGLSSIPLLCAPFFFTVCFVVLLVQLAHLHCRSE